MIFLKKIVYASLALILAVGGILYYRHSRSFRDPLALDKCKQEIEGICPPQKGIAAILRCAPFRFDQFSPICGTLIKYQFELSYRIIRVRESAFSYTRACLYGDEPSCRAGAAEDVALLKRVTDEGTDDVDPVFGDTLSNLRRRLDPIFPNDL